MTCRSLRFRIQALFIAARRPPRRRRRKHQNLPHPWIPYISVRPPRLTPLATSITTATRTETSGSRLWIIALAAALILLAGSRFLEAGGNLPITPVETLAGQKLSFPAALAGKPAVCVFGFSKEAGDHIKDWMARLRKDSVNAWSVANLEGAPALVRGMIRSSMRKGTPPSLLERSLIMTKDEQAWKRALGARDDKLPVVTVLDEAGNIVWTYEGLADDEAYSKLRAKLGALSVR
jgi:hypothetical protein